VSVDALINAILDREGDAYTDDSLDAGGPTKYGITLATLQRARGTSVVPADVEGLKRGEAFAIYEWLYITKPGFDRLISVSQQLGEELIDMGVNMGTAIATLCLQRLLNALNDSQRLYPDVRADGDCGPGTLAALRRYLEVRGNDGMLVLLRGILGLKIARYVDVTEHRPANERFLYGWLRARTGLTTQETA
jgi:lysozyme family protein